MFVIARLLLIATVATNGCMMIGPDYVQPDAPVGESWLDPRDPEIGLGAEPVSAWWETFGDPILSALVIQAVRDNPTLQAAGVRVLESQAQRGIAIGTLFPQTQVGVGAYSRSLTSRNRAIPSIDRSFDDVALGLDAAWELDLWGRFRRDIESADAELLAAVASYDDVLVSLLAEVATNYIGLRALEQERGVAERNAKIQADNFTIASLRYAEGAESQLDAAQAETILRRTEALLPALDARIHQTGANLCALLGMPPTRLDTMLGDQTGVIPRPTAAVAVGVPADLLRRRPDVRRAERLLAAQSAQIGVAKSDLLPRLSLVGSISVDAENVRDLFEGDSLEGFGGPSFRWAILNYGRIANNVRVQDARYQALVGEYETTVLGAQAEVEGAIAFYVSAIRRTALLEQSVAAAENAVAIVSLQYREGAAGFTTVLLAQDFLIQQQSALVVSRGQIAVALVALYRALGGGWELREGQSLVSEETAAAMAARTRWGAVLTEHGQRRDIEAVSTGAPWWRAWWPRW